MENYITQDQCGVTVVDHRIDKRLWWQGGLGSAVYEPAPSIEKVLISKMCKSRKILEYLKNKSANAEIHYVIYKRLSGFLEEEFAFNIDGNLITDNKKIPIRSFGRSILYPWESTIILGWIASALNQSLDNFVLKIEEELSKYTSKGKRLPD